MNRLLIAAAFVFAFAPLAYASTTGGTFSNGVSTGIEGVVMVAPTASPVAGIYTSAQSVTLTAAGSPSIHYTTDGSTTPICTSPTVYTTAISVSASQVIQALSCYPNGVASAVVPFAYAINPPSAPAPSTGGGGGGGGGGSILPPPVVVGDATGDSIVNVLDFNAVIVAWGSTGSNIPADLNRDGVVDILDFNILIINWTT